MGLWQTLRNLGTDEGTVKAKHEGKITLTAEELGTSLVDETLQSSRELFKKFTDHGVIAHLSVEESIAFSVELTIFELVCKTLSLAYTYGQGGYKAAQFLTQATLTAIAKNVEAKDFSRFVDATIDRYNSHYQYYAHDIWKTFDTEKRDPFRFPIDDKILRMIFHPVTSVSLEEPKVDWSVADGIEKAAEAHKKEQEKVPNQLALATLCYVHAVTSIIARASMAQKYTLSDG
jgi:hypothetical protein